MGKYDIFNSKKIFGDGIFNSDGENWSIQRKTASSLFHFNNLQAFVPVCHAKKERKK